MIALCLKSHFEKLPPKKFYTDKIFGKIAAEILDEKFASVVYPKINFVKEPKQQLYPLFSRRNDRTEMENYRPVSILNIFAKIFEKQLKNMIEPYWNQ